jgi:dipeptidyl aminopeptidase/acylaminoacyl peptidase
MSLSLRFLLILVLAFAAAVAPAADRRRITTDDYAAIRDVGDPQLSADGEWVVYTVDSVDRDADGWQSDLWLVRWDGSGQTQLTHGPDSESAPRFSPDGRTIAFLSNRRVENETEQLWLLPRAGGEAERVTDLPGEVLEFAWAPDSQRLALVVADPKPDAGLAEDETPPPIVIDRYYFKEDETGYLGRERRHLYLLDLASRKVEILTPGSYDEIRPSWSPDGQQLAFLSKRTGDWDRNYTYGLYVMAPRPGAVPRLLTTFESVDASWLPAPAWRPDGGELAVVSDAEAKLIYYGVHRIAVVSAEGGPLRLLTAGLDRNVEQPQWSRDGRWLYFLMEDDGNQSVARVRAAGGAVERVTREREEAYALRTAGRDRRVVLRATPQAPPEVYALEAGGYRALSRQNDALLAQLDLAPVEETRYRSRDGTAISGFMVRPRGVVAGRRYPTILEIHGGPASQFANAFDFTWQLLAAEGYAVIAANPRGSTGKGQDFSSAIYADWGNKDAEDVLAAVDDAVARGVADAGRLGVFGWSYGGILTNYVIAQDQRFKVAISGSSISNVLAGYGTDQYVREYELELGTPWQQPDTWIRLSFPFLKADRITTPTLFMCGAADFNVPLLNSEQMYQALRSLNVPTELVIYPGEFHGLSKLSYLEDRTRRRLEWFGRYLR